MKRVIILLCMVSLGCVSTTYHKAITVQKDAEGRITGITVVEEITQKRSETPHPFKYLDE